MMAWGTELWDQFDNVSAHTLKGIEFLEKYGRFQKDRCDVENRYAADLRGLVKKYLPKKKEEEDGQFSVQAAYRRTLSEVSDLAGQHELVAEQLAASVTADISTVVREVKDDRKRLLQEGARLHVQLQNQRLQLDKSKKNYEKAFREAEKALDAYRRADADLNLSRAEVEKHRMASSLRGQQGEDCKNEYANQLQKTNDLQHQHYTALMPALFSELERLEERRARTLQAHLRRAVDIERHVFPIVHTCLDGMVAAADAVDPERDCQLVVERFKSGFDPPESIPFDDLSDWRPEDAPLPPPPAGSPRPNTVKGTLSAGKFKKRGGIFGIFSGSKEDLDSLPPNQRRKKIQHRMDELTGKISQETSTRDGLMKMKGVYEGNPALGDPMTIETQLRENTQKLEKLRQELHKYQTLLDGGGTRSSLGEPDSNLSRSVSDTSVARAGAAAHGRSAPSTPPSIHVSSNSPESGLGTSHTSLPNSMSDEEATDTVSGGGPEPVDLPDAASTYHGGDSSAHHGGDPSAYHGGDPSGHHGGDPSANHGGDPSGYHGGDPSGYHGGDPSAHHGGDSSGYHGGDPAGAEEDDDPLPALGTAQALYAFDASSEGSIPMAEGEQLLVIELDQGDGWTRVRRETGLEEGFVPSAYLQVQLYPSC